MKIRIKAAIFSIILSLATLYSLAQTVNTQFGKIQGIQNGSIYQFLGIPFAKPPVGNMRWKAPMDPQSWNDTLKTISFAPVCPQKQFQQGNSDYVITGSEDCLYLNIWTPQIGAGTRPVLVFIHGGGNQQGSASEVNGGTLMYFGKNMAERGNAVVVTIQYRLGPFGFLVHPGLEPENAGNTSGNYAVLDQILALKWIKNNISAFGGDANKVMIFGESAGGLNVGNLMLTPLAAGLFQRACIQSATPVVDTYNERRNKGIAFVDSFIAAGTPVEKISYMRTLPSDSLVKDQTSPVSGGTVGMAWIPVIDNYVFFKTPYESFQSGAYNKVPLLIGSNADEMSLSAPATVYPFMVTALINASVPPAYQSEAANLYPAGQNTTEARNSYVGILSDAQFTVNARRTAQCVSVNQTEPVWRYFFTHKHTVAALTDYGSYHGMELFYVFNNWENATLGKGILFKPADDSVQKVMLNYWVNFANTGNPNSAGLVNWPQYNGSTDCYLEIKATPVGTQCGLRTAKSNLWDNAVGYLPCNGSVNIENSKKPKFSVYPNPTGGIVYFNRAEYNSPALVTVYTPDGRKIKQLKVYNELDIADLPGGLYLIEMVQQLEKYRIRIIKK